MIGFGWTNPFPFNLGGGSSTKEVLRKSILGSIEGSVGLDPDPSTGNYAETAGEAAIVAMIWSCNKRLSNQSNARKMLENLVVWEESTGLKPTNEDTSVDRRARLSGKIRGQTNNAISDIEDVAREALGVNFEAVILVDPDDVIAYWPGVNPGPPGYEWSSNQAHIAIKMNQLGLNDVQFLEKRDWFHSQMQNFLPAWMTFEIGVGDSFVAASGILGQSIL